MLGLIRFQYKPSTCNKRKICWNNEITILFALVWTALHKLLISEKPGSSVNMHMKIGDLYQPYWHQFVATRVKWTVEWYIFRWNKYDDMNNFIDRYLIDLIASWAWWMYQNLSPIREWTWHSYIFHDVMQHGKLKCVRWFQCKHRNNNRKNTRVRCLPAL